MMTQWLEEFPVLRIMRKQIAAENYNRIRLGLFRQRLPWRVQLKGFPCLEFILDDSAWICIDECQNSLPILAWTNFKIARRSALDAPIECELRLYHIHAGLVMGTALEALAATIDKHKTRHASEHYPVSKIRR